MTAGGRRGPLRRLLATVLCVVPLGLALAACGPTAEQSAARQMASVSPAPAPSVPVRRTSAPALPAPLPAPTPTPTPEPLKVGVTGNQEGMPQPVQDACQFLLRRDTASFPAAEAGDCLRAAMIAGSGATQTLTTASSWIPPGTHTMQFTTAPEFSLRLEDSGLGLKITAGAGGGSVDTGGGRVSANTSGTPEEVYAAVLSRAAELTANPDRVAELLQESDSLTVDYGAVLDGAARTKISGHRPADAEAGDMMPTSVTLWLDDFYRPVRFELSAQTRGITSSITADNTGWGS
ncbi:hypothetical protein ACIQXM_06290 [Arthrobacter sp. NPDC097144]|uniref:hypothetical protein n=1 Tax=Arthrobacter sp. NPDC097144 TaxID=3363946 RepID=UPI0037F7F26A